MIVEKINYIEEVAKTRSISKAAKNLGISQPALSAYLKKQESKLGVVLFDRTKIPLEVTAEGKAYIKYLDGVLDLFNVFKKEINRIGHN